MSEISIRKGLFLTLAGIFLASAPAAAVTLDFSSGAYSIDGANQQVYTEQGYSFSTPPGNHFDSNTFPGNTIVPGVPYLVFHEAAANPVNNLITLSFGGAAFDLLGFDLIFDTPILAFNPVINPPMLVSGSGGQSLITPLGASPGFVGTVLAGFMSVTSVTFDIQLNSTAAGNVMLDNVVVRSADAPPTVPLPATIYLLGVGITGLVYRRLKQIKVA